MAMTGNIFAFSPMSSTSSSDAEQQQLLAEFDEYPYEEQLVIVKAAEAAATGNHDFEIDGDGTEADWAVVVDVKSE